MSFGPDRWAFWGLLLCLCLCRSQVLAQCSFDNSLTIDDDNAAAVSQCETITGVMTCTIRSSPTLRVLSLPGLKTATIIHIYAQHFTALSLDNLANSPNLDLRIYDVQPAANISLASLTETRVLYIQPQLPATCSQATRVFPASVYMNRLTTSNRIFCICCAGEWHGFPMMVTVTNEFQLDQPQDLIVHGFHNVSFVMLVARQGSAVLAGFDNFRASSYAMFTGNTKLEITGLNGVSSSFRLHVDNNQEVSISGFNGLYSLGSSTVAPSFKGNAHLNITGFNGVTNFRDSDIALEGNTALYLSGFNGQVTMKSLSIKSSQLLVVDGLRGSLTTVNAMDISGNTGSVSLPGLSGNVTVGTSLTIQNNAASSFDLGSSFCGPLSVAQNLRIANNAALEHLSCSFSQLVHPIASITISGNPALTSVSGLCTSAFMAASGDAVAITNNPEVCCEAIQSIFSDSPATVTNLGCATSCTPAALNAICACENFASDLCPSNNHCENQLTDRCSDCVVGTTAVNYTACVDCTQLHGPHCLACDLSSCSTCNASVIINNGACEECPNGQYAQTTATCAACTSLHGPFCQSCDAHACTSCDASVTRIDGQCIECPTGQYASDEATCTSCSSLYGSECLSCDIHSCTSCDAFVTRINGTCVACPVGEYALNETTCAACSEKHGAWCEQCVKDACVVCDASVIVDNGTCTACPTGHYAFNASVCEDCTSIHGLDCEVCSKDACDKCDVAVTLMNGACTECPNGQYAFNESFCEDCTQAHGVHCQSCNAGSCVTCDDSVILNGGQCSECPWGQYASNSTTCSECSELHGAFCQACQSGDCSQCDDSVILVNDTCLECPLGQHALNGSKCQGCKITHGPFCLSCDKGACLDCNDSVILSNGHCVECPAGQFALNGTICSDCSSVHGDDCHECTAAACIICGASVILNHGMCQECPEGQYANTSLSCAACSELHGDECLSCSQSECLSCNSSSTLQAGSCALCSGLHDTSCTRCNVSSCSECESSRILFKNRCREPCRLSCQHGSTCELLDENQDSPPPHQHCRCSPHFSGELCQTPAIGLDSSVSASQLDQPVMVSSSLVLPQGLTVDQVALDSLQLKVSGDFDSLIVLFNSSLPTDQGSQASIAFSFTSPDRVAISFIPLSSFWPDSRGSLVLDLEASLLLQGQSLTTTSNTTTNTNNDTNTVVTFESLMEIKTAVVIVETSDNSTISGGAIAGIVVGVVAGIVLFCFLFRRYRDQNPRTSPSSSNSDALEMKGVAL